MINEEKNKLRKEMLSKRNDLSKDFANKKSTLIENYLFGLDEFKNSEKIFIYHSFKNEPNTLNIIEKSLEEGKVVALPFTRKDSQMDFFKIENLSSLKKGALGIPEPSPDSDKIIPDEKTLIVTPGVVFDIRKNRIGMGKGFYDRYFEKYKDINFSKIGLCYNFQIVQSLPCDKYDVPLNKLISEEGVIE